jgi:hypothetical protein
MTALIDLVVILQTFSISLGTGASTLAIINFFVAIADGKIDETERKMMGIVYKVLRVAMVTILATTAFIIASEYGKFGLNNLSAISISQIIVLAVLYGNAVLMTAHLVPSTFGPAIQAGSWYTLGVISSLQIIGVTNYTTLQFLLGYITWIILAVGIVNGIMAILKHKKLANK